MAKELVEVKKTETGLDLILKTGERISADIVIMSVGVKAETSLAIDAGLEIGKSGGILVDEYMQTSDKNIYAVGDAVESWDPIFKIKRIIPLAGPANKQARIAANNIVLGNKEKFNGSVGTAIAKIFGINAAITGFNEKFLRRNGIEFLTTVIYSNSHATYYPGATPILIKLIFRKNDGLVLGAQVVGKDGVDKVIDVLSIACQKGFTVYDLKELEHSYAPPFSSAKSPANMIGFVAENILEKMVLTINFEDIKAINFDETFLLDVRNKSELLSGLIDNSVNIPLHELRNRMNEIPNNKKIFVHCASGLRSYLAARILLQNGFSQVYNFSGGYNFYKTLIQ